jgi:hypothetical protein
MSFITEQLVGSFVELQNEHGEAITYRRGNETVDLIAVPGTSEAEALGDDQLVVNVELKDWLVLASELQFGTGQSARPITPQIGDRIELTNNGRIEAYRVSHPNTSAPPFKRRDARGLMLRIHSTLVEMPAPAPSDDE